MAIISQETFEKLSVEEKQNIRSHYEAFDEPMLLRSYEDLFGKENLQPKKPKTWKEVIELYPHLSRDIDNLLEIIYIDPKIVNKLIAAYKIVHLIELGYGGMITNKEWKDAEVIKHCVVRDDSGLKHCCFITDYEFIAFHTCQQYEEFMSYPENRELTEQYYLM